MYLEYRPLSSIREVFRKHGAAETSRNHHQAQNRFPGSRNGQPFRLWIDECDNTADPDELLSEYTTMGSGRMFQFQNAAYYKFWEDAHIHVCQDGNSFDIGQEQLKPASQYAQDYFINSGWNFFKEANVAIALRIDNRRTGAMEIVIIDPTVNADHCYPSFQDFKDAVRNRCELTKNYFRTSRGYVIEASENGGKVNGQPIWKFPFKRMETVDYRGNKLITWDNNVMTVYKKDITLIYDFNNWEYCDGKRDGDFISPAPPVNVSITPVGKP